MLRTRTLLILAGLLVVLAAATAGCRKQQAVVRLGGGPAGGTYQKVAAGLQEVLQSADPALRVNVERTGGSLANLKEIEEGNLEMAIVYAGDAYLAERGQLEKRLPPTQQVRALTRIYGATAHLAVLDASGIHAAQDLRRRRVAIGNPGSGAALAAERFFRSLGIWDEVIPVYLGYTMAAEDLAQGRVEAVWEMVGYPSESLAALSRRVGIRLLDVQSPSLGGGLFNTYPFYRPMVIPAGTYRTQKSDVPTFQDAALWVAAARVDAELVRAALAKLYTPEGLEAMRRAHPSTGAVDAGLGLFGVDIALHPGAEQFWQGQGEPQRP